MIGRSLLIGILIGLFVGGIIGFGAGLSSQTTLTRTVEVVRTQPATFTITEVRTQTYTTEARIPVYTTVTDTRTAILTTEVYRTTLATTTIKTTFYPAENGTVLITDSGSGNKDTRPFTLETNSDLKITITIRARGDLRFVSLHWYLYNVALERWIKDGEVDEKEGVFEFYAANVPAGNWYFKILAANCDWEIVAEKVT
ncbi:MAG: hypothetical protein QXU87_04070 [Candidatus Caldarchaeum sp.]